MMREAHLVFSKSRAKDRRNTRRRLRAAQRILLADQVVATKTEKAEDKRSQRGDRKLDSAMAGCQDRSTGPARPKKEAK